MDLSKLAEMTDAQLKTYTIAMKSTMTAPYKCFWNTDAHKSCSHNKAFNYVRHIVTCKHRQDHTSQVISKDSPMRFPIFEEDLNNYRGCLMQMNGCYEFMYERLGDRGWKTYNNKITALMIRFFEKYCNMGKVGYQQSVMYNGIHWKVKKNKDLDYVMLDSKQMFNFFINEFKPLLEEAMLNYITDSNSFEFWYFIITGERTSGQKRRLQLEKQIRDNPITTKIVGEHYIDKNSGKVVFTKDGKAIYKD
tara:strand:- start:228 stop:974 length:747 start_codon:yes stop_codon:yes gene_type:complete